MKSSTSVENLSRDPQPMPDFVRDALRVRNLVDSNDARPAYQRNDYPIWINKARRDEIKQKRLAQMLDELERGGVYMRMKWNG